MIKKIFVILIALSSTAFAKDDSQRVNEFVQNTAEMVLKMVDADIDDAATEAALTNIFEDVMDIEWMAKFAIGRNWFGLSKDQQSEYLQNYRNYLVKLYVPIFKKYNGQSFFLKKVDELNNNYYIVLTEIKSEGSKALYKVEYRVKDLDGKYKVRDIIAEGVSLISTQRSDFGSIISGKGIDELNKSLVDKIK